jgi:hypothetical protein
MLLPLLQNNLLTQGQNVVITANAGSYALTGTDAGLTAQRLITADATSYSLNGVAANFDFQRKIQADSAAYALNGLTAGLTSQKLISADAGSYTLTGIAAQLSRQITIAANAGTFNLTGVTVSLIYTPTGNKILTADAGSYQFAGYAIDFLRGRVMSADAASYDLSGVAVSLQQVRKLIAGQGAFAITGIDTQYVWLHILGANQATYVITTATAALLLNVPQEAFKSFLGTLSKDGYLSSQISKESNLNASISGKSYAQNIELESIHHEEITY